MFILFDGANGTSFNTFLEIYFCLFNVIQVLYLDRNVCHHAFICMECSNCQSNNLNTHQGFYVWFVTTKFECMFQIATSHIWLSTPQIVILQFIMTFNMFWKMTNSFHFKFSH